MANETEWPRKAHAASKEQRGLQRGPIFESALELEQKKKMSIIELKTTCFDIVKNEGAILRKQVGGHQCV